MTQQAAAFGNHFALLEMCDLHACRNAVTDAQVAQKVTQFREEFDVAPSASRRKSAAPPEPPVLWTP